MRITILFIFILISSIFSQISQGGSPKGIDIRDENTILVYDMESTIDRNFHPMVFQYGIEYDVDFNILEITPSISNEENTYYLEVFSEGAYGISLIFDDFYMSENSELFLYDYNQTMFLGSFTSKNNKPDNVFPTSVIKSDRIIIELTVPNDELDQVRLNLDSFIHDYTDIMNYYSTEATSNREDCNTNVACPEGIGYEDQINGTIRVTMGSGLCSASIINNTLNDRTPYVLFADHCVSGSASGYVFLFNYQASTCNGTFGSENQSVSGSTLLSSADINSGPDYALLEMTSNIPDSYNPYYVGWSRATLPPQDVFGVHHPGAGLKKITLDGTTVNGNGYYWEFQYNDGRVIPGSSGSPLFDNNKRQVGIASFIYTNYCDPSPDCYCAQQYSHGYGRFDSAMSLGMASYLDPLNSGVISIDGIGISGINISHSPIQDSPFEESELLIQANVSAYTGNIEGVELIYDIGEGWVSTEMESSFGNNYAGVIPNLYNGMLVEYYIMAINSEGIVENYPSNAPENTIIFTIGDLPDYYFTDFESNSDGWVVGEQFVDNASAGIWELAIPVATFDDEGNQVQPGVDVTTNGNYCFVTGNGYEDGNGGFDDVDGGQTTLFSPIFNLEDYNEVLVSYWYWYTNNVGDNAGNDLWRVYVSNNAGSSWVDLQITSNSSNAWVKNRTILSDLITFTDSMQFKFIAEDLSYPGDNGSGGSLVEAAIDDFIIEYVATNSSILGDVNNDEILNVLDVVIIVNMVLGSESLNYFSADMNSDGAINVQDIIILINLILN